jgi:ATP-binding protein involved in chromosome partitioning
MDPELGRPIADLGMIDSIDIDDQDRVTVTVLLTTGGCPLRDHLTQDVTQAVLSVEGVTDARVTMGVMNEEQREAVRATLRGGTPEPVIAFAQPGSTTRVIAIASGKGGVGKSSLAVNLACALAAAGKKVGLLDADIYGHSIPDMLGIGEDEGPTVIEDMDLMLPVEAHGITMMSIGMMKPDRHDVVAWRGPILDRALSQFLTDVHWGDLDYFLIDLPPGTGDVAISIGQKLPNAEVIVVTTPQMAATEVAERAGTMASIMKQRVLGVVENMSYLDTSCPHCGQSHRVDVFGTGGGAEVAASLTSRLGYDIALLAEIPLEPDFRVAGDKGTPSVVIDPTRPAAAAIVSLADRLINTKRNLAGFRLNLGVE